LKVKITLGRAIGKGVHSGIDLRWITGEVIYPAPLIIKNGSWKIGGKFGRVSFVINWRTCFQRILINSAIVLIALVEKG